MKGTTELRRNAAIDLLRAASILYVVGYWHLLGYVDGITAYKNPFTYRLTVVVLGLFTLMAGVLAGRRPIRSAREVWLYYRARSLRILPPYALALLVFGLTHLLHWRDVARGLLLLLRHRLTIQTGSAAKCGLVLAIGIALAVALLHRFADGPLDPRLALYVPAFASGLLLSAPLIATEGGRAMARRFGWSRWPCWRPGPWRSAC
jgi:hypothetical protein